MAMSMTTGGTSQGYHNVFVYGSLLADEVVQVLLNRVPSSTPATLPDFQRFSIKGRVYPAILPVENKKVLGRVLKGVTNLELDILDIFEDIEYVRDTVEVTLVDNLGKLQTYAYVWNNKNDPDLYGDWDFEKWKSAHMKDFIEMTKEFVEELELPESKSRVETYNSFYQSVDGGKSSMP
ncbi:AIG2-like protein D [Chenopodium quinoa]|uniref:Putative gamma-glutamylcyclotransferase n=1 Tax=Chenopodium quinoa TaxID=63459 RepID=A0A803N199_CHEQI|nr:AIG2-like protein D [Chenopodium quinoa]